MNFADILDDIARPRPPSGADERQTPGAPSAAFWSVLDTIAAAAPLSETAVRQAYRPDAGPRGTPVLSDTVFHVSELSLDPDDIAYELDLDTVTSVEELSTVRRRFARLNHPDRVEASLRERANTRMTIANAMIDTAARRFAG